MDPGVPLLLCIAPSWAWGGCRAGWGYPSPKVARSWLWFFFFLARGASQMFCMMLNASSPILKSPPPGGDAPSLGGAGGPMCPCSPRHGRVGCTRAGLCHSCLWPQHIYYLKRSAGAVETPMGCGGCAAGRGHAAAAAAAAAPACAAPALWRCGEGDAAGTATRSASSTRAPVGPSTYKARRRGTHLWSPTPTEPNNYRAEVPAAEGWPLWKPAPIQPNPRRYRARATVPAMQSPGDQSL